MYDHDSTEDADETQRTVIWRKQVVSDTATTERAWGIDIGPNPPGSKYDRKIIWFPKSRVELKPSDEDPNFHDIYLPFWLAEKHDLENLVEEEVE